jgi:flavin reductase (DIM6/NTAB) family NADH-FMN oxidoreductase RutF
MTRNGARHGLLAGTLVSFLDGWRGDAPPARRRHEPAADRARRSEVPLAGAACDADGFRQVMGMFPSPVSVVTALDRDGEPRGLTCSAVCSLSMEPPALLCCVNRRNHSLDAIRDSGGFAVNLLRAGRNDLSNVFASGDSAKFAGTNWRPGPVTGMPLLAADSLAHVECELSAEVQAGSHMILIGLVRATEVGEPEDGPLVYWRRAYGCWHDGRRANDRQ